MQWKDPLTTTQLMTFGKIYLSKVDYNIAFAWPKAVPVPDHKHLTVPEHHPRQSRMLGCNLIAAYCTTATTVE